MPAVRTPAERLVCEAAGIAHVGALVERHEVEPEALYPTPVAGGREDRWQRAQAQAE